MYNIYTYCPVKDTWQYQDTGSTFENAQVLANIYRSLGQRTVVSKAEGESPLC